MGLLVREHPKAQPGGGFRRSPGSNLRPLVYFPQFKASSARDQDEVPSDLARMISSRLFCACVYRVRKPVSVARQLEINSGSGFEHALEVELLTCNNLRFFRLVLNLF